MMNGSKKYDLRLVGAIRLGIFEGGMQQDSDSVPVSSM
jgi:hypothetical protein